MSKLKVTIINEVTESRNLNIKMDELISKREIELRALGAKTTESVYVKDGKVRSLQRG